MGTTGQREPGLIDEGSRDTEIPPVASERFLTPCLSTPSQCPPPSEDFLALLYGGAGPDADWPVMRWNRLELQSPMARKNNTDVTGKTDGVAYILHGHLYSFASTSNCHPALPAGFAHCAEPLQNFHAPKNDP